MHTSLHASILKPAAVSSLRARGLQTTTCRVVASGSRSASVGHGETNANLTDIGRRDVLSLSAVTLAASSLLAFPAQALPGFEKDLNKNRRRKIPAEDYKDGPQGLKYYDVVEGSGPLAKEGERVVVHYDCKWKGITFITSRQGMGVTGGTPLGFDVGAEGAGGTLKGLDLGVRGMRVGGQRKLLVPPELAYGSRGIGEIPPNATLEFDVELLSIKTSPFGARVKIIEG